MMQGGRIAALDAPSALQDGLRGRALAFECADPTSAADLLREVPGVRSAALFGQSVHLTLERAGMEHELEAALAESGVAVASVRDLDPSLEDVFIDLASHDHAA
jgi:hypothetical protein